MPLAVYLRNSRVIDIMIAEGNLFIEICSNALSVYVKSKENGNDFIMKKKNKFLNMFIFNFNLIMIYKNVRFIFR